MERLNERLLNLKKGVESMTEPEIKVSKLFLESVCEYMQKLKEYKDLEEQGLLLKLPCKVGDTVWDNDFGKTCGYTITGYSFGKADRYIDEPVTETDIVYYYENSNGSITGSFAASLIGKSVFLTKAEAEQALQRMKEGGM